MPSTQVPKIPMMRVASAAHFFFFFWGGGGGGGGFLSQMRKTPQNAHTGVSSGVIGKFCRLSLFLPSYFVYVSNEGSGESAHMRRLTLAFVARQCDVYQNLIILLICLNLLFKIMTCFAFLLVQSHVSSSVATRNLEMPKLFSSYFWSTH